MVMKLDSKLGYKFKICSRLIVCTKTLKVANKRISMNHFEFPITESNLEVL
jgi:hypothetical protein